MSDIYLPYTEIYRRVQERRAELGMRPLRSINSLSARLHKLRHKGEHLHRRYSLADALRTYCTMRPRRQPWNRYGTEAEIASRKFMPLLTAVAAYRCHICRFDNAIHRLNLLAWRHPVTGERWVHIEQAEYVAQWRSITLLRRHLTPSQLEHITSTRPVRTTYTGDGYTQTCYFVPEYSHLGTRTTRYTKEDIYPPKNTKTMKTIELTAKQFDIDTTTEDSTRRSLIDAATDRATEAFNATPASLLTGCAYALLTSFFALEFALRLTEGDDDPQDVTALRHETLRHVLHMAGIEFNCKITPNEK